LQIGTIMLVTGVAQLIIAPCAVTLERYLDARLLSAVGFALFAGGLGSSALQTPQTEFDAMLWPQLIRGGAIMFCLLPPTRLALGTLAKCDIADASGLFNLMRNLGGAIGLALIDTVIYSRSDLHGDQIIARLQAGDLATAHFIGIPPALLAAHPGGPLDASALAMLQPLIGKAALTLAINDAWALLAALTVAALICLPLARRLPLPATAEPSVIAPQSQK
jgi:DHA2 family multidrug resistance protein